MAKHPSKPIGTLTKRLPTRPTGPRRRKVNPAAAEQKRQAAKVGTKRPPKRVRKRAVRKVAGAKRRAIKRNTRARR